MGVDGDQNGDSDSDSDGDSDGDNGQDGDQDGDSAMDGDDAMLVDSASRAESTCEGWPSGGASTSEAAFSVVLLPAAAGAQPRVEFLTTERRLDYLNVLTERLGGGGALAMHAKYEGQSTKQPVLYFLLHGSQQAAHNELASRLAGVEVRGDTILADVATEGGASGEYNSIALRCGGVQSCELFLARNGAGPLAFLMATFGCPLLGAYSPPRLEAWPPAHAPTSVLLSYLQSCDSRLDARWWSEAVDEDEEGHPAPQSPFIATVSMNAHVADGAVELQPEWMDGDAFKAHFDGPPCRSKKEAERAAAFLVLQPLLQGDAPPSPLQILNVTRATVSDSALEAGGIVKCSYRLVLLPEGGAVGGASGSDCTLEEQETVEVTLGGGLLHPEVDALLAELAADWVAAKSSRATVDREVVLDVAYRGVARRCLLSLQVHGAAQAEEFELAGGGDGGPSLGAQRVEKLCQLLQTLEPPPTSLADVGCGEGKLLRCLLEDDRLRCLQQLIGTDVNETSLRRGGEKVREKLAERLAAAADGRSLPSVALWCCGISQLELPMRCDVLMLVEVVEHLDPPELETLGEALLGRCAPRTLIVTTPNKEFNLNLMVCCSEVKTRGHECAGRGREGITFDAIRADRSLCKGCRLYTSLRNHAPRPALELYKLRQADHRFEWTRGEFRKWAAELAAQHGYDVRFDGIGGGAMDEERDPTNPCHGPGPSSQVAIFQRQAVAEPAAAALRSAVQQPQSSPCPLKLVWSSEGNPWSSLEDGEAACTAGPRTVAAQSTAAR